MYTETEALFRARLILPSAGDVIAKLYLQVAVYKKEVWV